MGSSVPLQLGQQRCCSGLQATGIPRYQLSIDDQQLVHFTSTTVSILIGGTAFWNSFFGQTTGQIHLNRVQCSGYESRLLDCRRTNYFYYCSHSRSAGVRCSSETAPTCSNGDIRLVGGEVAYEGRVEICYTNTWATVCHDNWGYLDAIVVCHQLGYSGMKLHSL